MQNGLEKTYGLSKAILEFFWSRHMAKPLDFVVKTQNLGIFEKVCLGTFLSENPMQKLRFCAGRKVKTSCF